MPHSQASVPSSSHVDTSASTQAATLPAFDFAQAQAVPFLQDNPTLKNSVCLLPQTNYLKSLLTQIRNKNSLQADFVFYSHHVFRLLFESGLNLLPFENCPVETPLAPYHGVQLRYEVCGVSVVRAGESMEAILRDICPWIAIGKILIQRDEHTKQAKLYYSNLPKNISNSYVLVLEPMLATGGSAKSAVEVLLKQGVSEEKIIFINVLSAPEGLAVLCAKYPKLKVVTAAIDEHLNKDAFISPGLGDFGDRYFGT